jgi:uncharacterized protein (TIGR02145 family)
MTNRMKTMKTMKTILMSIILSFFLIRGFAQTETTHPDNGRTIILNNDGTWNYKHDESLYDEAKNMLTDKRDGRQYKTIMIGKQVWMAENLNHKTEKSWCYKNDSLYCKKYGRLYNYHEALKVCPIGWHLPSAKDWRELENHLGGKETAATKLKSKTGWNTYKGNDGNGTNESGFNAKPAGMRGDNEFAYHYAGKKAYFWSSAPMDYGRAWNRILTNENEEVGSENFSKSYGHSVRCVKD